MDPKLREILASERELYIPGVKTWKERIITWYAHSEEYEIYRFICALRKAEFYKGKKKLVHLYYVHKRNLWGRRLGFAIIGVLGKGVRLWHKSIMINPASKIGDGCAFHGYNCVGNNGADGNCPVLGKNVDVGVGAKILGPVTLADGIRIGANAVVINSFTEPGITIVGIPAVKVRPRDNT